MWTKNLIHLHPILQNEEKYQAYEEKREKDILSRQQDGNVHLQRGGGETARHPPDGGPEHQRVRRIHQAARPVGDTERGLHGLPARGKPHAEERVYRQIPV